MRYIATLLLLLAVSGQAQGQQSQWYFTYNMAAPTGDTKDFISAYSWRGMGFEGRRMYGRDYSLGLSLSWNVLHEKAFRLSNLNRADVSGTQLRTVNAFPLFLNANRHFRLASGWEPYVGLHAGAAWMEERVDVGLFRDTGQQWHFGLAPAVGIAIPIDVVSFLVDARYNYFFESNQRKHSWLGFNIGFGYRY